MQYIINIYIYIIIHMYMYILYIYYISMVNHQFSPFFGCPTTKNVPFPKTYKNPQNLGASRWISLDICSNRPVKGSAEAAGSSVAWSHATSRATASTSLGHRPPGHRNGTGAPERERNGNGWNDGMNDIENL